MGYQIQKDESRRYEALKMLMCVFVLLIHAFSDDFRGVGWTKLGTAYHITYIVSRMVCDCAVPMFIVMSSVLLYAKPFSWWGNVKKKCRSLLVPYLIFNSLWVVLMFVKHVLGQKLGIVAGDDIDFSTYSLFDWLDAFLGLTGDYKPLLTTLWYVRDLFILNVLATPLRKLIDRMPVPMLVLTLVLWFGDIHIPGIQDYSLPFFILGYYLVKYGIHFQDLDRKLPIGLVLAAYLLSLFVVVLLQRQSTALRAHLLVAVVFWILCSRYLVRCTKLIDLIAPASFFIYLSHRFVYAIIQVVMDGSLLVYLIAYILKPVCALAVLLGVFYFLKRFLPGLLEVLVGGRGRKVRKEVL